MTSHLVNFYRSVATVRASNVRRRAMTLGLILGAPLAVPLVAAAETTPLQAVVNLSSTATLEVTKDLLNIVFNTTREGADAAAVQSQLKQALDTALAEAKRVAKPGQLEVQTGNFPLSPRYTNKGVVSGWQGTTELIVEGSDMQAIGQLSGRITTLTINRVGYALSRELREKSEGEVSAQAIARFRAKATTYATHFGYAGYTLREVNVSGNEQPSPMRRMAMQTGQALTSADEVLPVEPGKGSVTVNVNGTVQMLK